MWRPGHRLPAIFVVTFLLPGIFLAVFAVRSWMQERRLADQQIRERLERAAQTALRKLEQALDQWQLALEQLNELAPSGSRRWPGRIHDALNSPDSNLLVFREAGELRTFPPGRVLYIAGPATTVIPPDHRMPPLFAEAEHLELRERDYSAAIRLYKQLLQTAAPIHRPLLLNRLARSYRKAGRLDQAIHSYKELGRTTGPAGSVPADLASRFELCSLWEETNAVDNLKRDAVDFYQGLVDGRWSLEKGQYLFYSSRVQDWLKRSVAPHDAWLALHATEEAKIVLTRVVEELLQNPRPVLAADGAAYLGFWRPAPFVALILSDSFTRTQVWPEILDSTNDSDLHISLLSRDGFVLVGRSSPSQGSMSLRRNLEAWGLPWLIEVQPRDLDALNRGFEQRQKLYLAFLSVLVALLVFGGYLTVRTVRRELEIARLKSEFVSTVSHEFRSPLTGIRQLGDMLVRGRWKSEERRQEYYRMIVRESDRLARLVDNMLDFSRMEEGRKQYNFAPLQTEGWLKELVQNFQAEVAGQDFSVIANIPPGIPSIRGDRQALDCAVHNLLDNAVKYSLGPKMVWLDADSADGKVSIQVRDRGVGISEEDQKYIFEKFFRGGGDIARQVKGAGIGLTLVRQIIAAHGGSIDFQSMAGRGSTFSIHLPFDGPSPEE